MSLKLVTFDLDDTLWDVAPVMHNAEARLRDHVGDRDAGRDPEREPKRFRILYNDLD